MGGGIQEGDDFLLVLCSGPRLSSGLASSGLYVELIPCLCLVLVASVTVPVYVCVLCLARTSPKDRDLAFQKEVGPLFRGGHASPELLQRKRH